MEVTHHVVCYMLVLHGTENTQVSEQQEKKVTET